MNVFRRWTHGLAEALAVKRLRRPFIQDAANGWVARLPRWAPQADCQDDPFRSTLVLYEDWQPLGPPHCSHAVVRAEGRGRYSHWQHQLLFSTCDNSDPNTNGRVYAVSIEPSLFDRLMLTRPPDLSAVNDQLRDASLEAIERDVAYALHIGHLLCQELPGGGASLRQQTVLEAGPGINYGCALYLACHGARVAVADRFLAPWDVDYHRPFYARLRERLRQQEPHLDMSPLEQLLDAGGYRDNVLRRYPHALEELGNLFDSEFDLVTSISVLEHVQDLEAAARSLVHITRPNGRNLHGFDGRDHRHFDRPLEYLLLDEARFRREFWFRRGECGNRWRPPECSRLLQVAGFELVRSTPGLAASPEYLHEFLPRLRAARHARYRDCPETDLQLLTAFYHLRRPGAVSTFPRKCA
jgi:SAM-dependent methyltransferase